MTKLIGFRSLRRTVLAGKFIPTTLANCFAATLMRCLMAKDRASPFEFVTQEKMLRPTRSWGRIVAYPPEARCAAELSADNFRLADKPTRVFAAARGRAPTNRPESSQPLGGEL